MLNFLTHIEQQRGNDATTRNARLAAIKAFMRYVEFRVPSALEQIRQIHAIPTKRHDQALVRHLTIGRGAGNPRRSEPDDASRYSGSRHAASLFRLRVARLRTGGAPTGAGLVCTGPRASVSSERAARSGRFHFGKRPPPISGPGWRYADPPVSQRSSSTPKVPR